MKLISKTEVLSSLDIVEAIDAVKQAFISLSEGTANIPQRNHISIPEFNGTTLVMPAYLPKEGSLICKLVSVFPNNSKYDSPVIQGILVLISEKTGEPHALIEASSLTALRTGAASGLATDLLARKDARTLAIFGTGAQSRLQIDGVCAVRKIERIYVVATAPEKAKSFIEEIESRIDAEIIVADSAEAAVRNADVICTATTSYTPVFDGNALTAGTHINGVGSYKPMMQEIDFATLKKSARILVDSRRNALTEAGDLMQAIAENVISENDIYGEIGEIAAGNLQGRGDDREITFFKSVGNAAQDAVVAKLIFEKVLGNGGGTEFNIFA